jgi:hypothetical protein
MHRVIEQFPTKFHFLEIHRVIWKLLLLVYLPHKNIFLNASDRLTQDVCSSEEFSQMVDNFHLCQVARHSLCSSSYNC